LQALEIDGKKAMAVYKTLSPKSKKALKQFYELLCKCFPQTPPKVTCPHVSRRADSTIESIILDMLSSDFFCKFSSSVSDELHLI
jgi:hypothetical protein